MPDQESAKSPAAGSSPPPPGAKPSYSQIKFSHSAGFAPLVRELGISLLVSTYQAGKLVSIGTDENGLRVSLNHFEQAMGLAIHPRGLAVGGYGVIWYLHSAPEFAARIEPAGRYDACYLTRRAFVTGNIHGHEMAWLGDELCIVNTRFSCLCTLDDEFSFVPRWQPPFITELEDADRCHLNGMAVHEGKPKYVTVMAESNERGGWRPTKATSGCILDVASGQAVSRGLAMPHSPRIYDGRLWVLHSGSGSLEVVDPKTGKRDVVTKVPGYTRGLAFYRHYAFIGLSKIRETAVFGGVPIAEFRDKLKCAVAVIDMRTGQHLAYLEFGTGVEEIFDVQVVPSRCITMTGPFPYQDDAKDVWVVPPPGRPPQRPSVGSSSAPAPMAGPRPVGDAEVAELVRGGLMAQQQGRVVDAVKLFKQAVAARPMAADLHCQLGNAWQDFARADLAEDCYRRAIGILETLAVAHQNLGYLLVNSGRLDEGVKHLERAQQLQPAAINRVMLATALPIVYESSDDVRLRRERMEAAVDRLVSDGVSIDVTNSLAPTNFFAAYQGCNDRDLQIKLGQLYRAPQLVGPGKRANQTGRIRVGFLSAHFRDHTIGRLNLGRIQHLDRTKFELTLVSLGLHQDPMAEAFRRSADQVVTPTGTLDAIRRQIAELKLDVLVFTDVGMNATTYTLAMSRLARVQCVTWGHPVTTGNASMDYFISSKLLETPEADAQYSERLIRLANLGTYYERPQATSERPREAFGWQPEQHIYLCPQTLFKMHPDFDPILAEILRRDPAGELVLIAGQQPHWTWLLERRLHRAMPDVAARIRFLPPRSNAEFLNLLASADVVLDTPHFGGGNSSYEALAVGVPIVTWPGPFLRSRITQALYRKMGVEGGVVNSAAEYVETAVRLGSIAEARRTLSEQIRAKSDLLFADPAEVRELERFLAWAADGGPGAWDS